MRKFQILFKRRKLIDEIGTEIKNNSRPWRRSIESKRLKYYMNQTKLLATWTI